MKIKLFILMIIFSLTCLASNNYPLFEKKNVKIVMVYTANYSGYELHTQHQERVNDVLKKLNEIKEVKKIVDIKNEVFGTKGMSATIIYEVEEQKK